MTPETPEPISPPALPTPVVTIRGDRYTAQRLTHANYLPIALTLFMPQEVSLESLVERKIKNLPMPDLDLHDAAQLARFSTQATLRLAKASITSEVAYRLRAIFPELPEELASYDARTETGYLGLDTHEVMAIALALTTALLEAEKPQKPAKTGFQPTAHRKPKPRR